MAHSWRNICRSFKYGLEVMEELHLAATNGDIPLPEIVTAELAEFQTA